MNIYNQLKEKIKSFPNSGTVVVQTDSESLLVKELFFKAGRKLVSDRDVFTLDYELTRHMSQAKGLRVLNDQLYPFLFDKGVKREAITSALDFIQNFPDPFVEPELASIVLEFLEQEESAANLLETFRESLLIASNKQELSAVPRGFANLYLNELEFDEETFFLSSLFDSLPYGFSDKFSDKVIQLAQTKIEWKDQIELFELYKDNKSFEFKNYDNQLEEVRYALSVLKDQLRDQKTLVLFPKNKGYEKLFYLYQREFFSKQVFSLYAKEEQTLERVLSKVSLEVKPFKTQYDSFDLKNKNKILTTENNATKYSLSEIMTGFFEDDFTELDLNIVSEILVQLGASRKLSLVDWKKIFEQEKIKIGRKHDRFQTDLNVHDYEYIAPEVPEEVLILGWSDALFKKTGDRIFSNSLMSKLEINLGLFLPSLQKSEAVQLFSNPVMVNSNVKKSIAFSSQSFLGGSNKPGVFKILMEQQKKSSEAASRSFKEKSPLTVSSKASFQTKNLSASSLQRYEECPYKFYLEKVIGLKKEDDEDYFLSAKQEGSLMHKVLEDLHRDDLTKENVIEKLKELISADDPDFDTFRAGAVDDFSERMWTVLKEEKKHLLESGIVNTLSEKFFKFDLDLKNKTLIEKDGDFSIRGLVDRVDIDKEQRAIVYDYKRGDSGTHSLSAYSGSKLAPQLFLYCLAADQGLLGDFKSFVGFQYINLSLYKRQKGFVIKKQADGIAKEIPSRSAVEYEKYEEKKEMFMKKLWKVLEQIESGYFEEDPNPSYSGQCESCTWLGVCKKSETFV